MPHSDFETLFTKLESNLVFVNDSQFMAELKASIQTPEQWVGLAKLYCDSAEKLIALIHSIAI